MKNIREYIVRKIVNKESRILEIGPLNRPVVTRTDFPNVFYCDIRSTEDIKKLYTSNSYLELTGTVVNIETIVDVDFVINDSYKAIFKDIEKFDFVIVSHVLEHMPDIINFLIDINHVLKPNGKIIVIQPDKNFSFDFYRESASFRDAYNVYQKKNNSYLSSDFYFNVVCQNHPNVFWNKNIQNDIPVVSLTDALNKERLLKTSSFEDVHYWPFTDYSFLKFLYDLKRAHIVNYMVTDFIETQYNEQEFFVLLETSKSNTEAFSQLEKKQLLKFMEKSTGNNSTRNKLIVKNTDLKKENDDHKERELLHNETILNQQKQLAALQQHILFMESSKSWKITKPLRKIITLIKRKK